MIPWRVEPEIFSIGFFTLRWYSLAFILSFLLGYAITRRIFTRENIRSFTMGGDVISALKRKGLPAGLLDKLAALKGREFLNRERFTDAIKSILDGKTFTRYRQTIVELSERRPEHYVDDLFIYVFIATLVGARLGHCLFYDPAYYLSHPLEILMIYKGGLASHGATIGILLALYWYARKREQITFLWLVDRVVIVIALAGGFIRLGNLMNSEIVGAPTDVPWAFLFYNDNQHADVVPRHPAQIYEAVAYFILFFLLYRMYNKREGRIAPGLFFGIFLTWIFGFRIFVERFKAVQVDWEVGLPLNMGQMLSIPLVVIGLYLIWQARRKGTEP